MASSELVRIQQRKSNKKAIDKAYENSSQSYLIHYSCESFYDNVSGQSRRVTSIAVRNLASAQTHSWSLHKSAELLGLLDDMNENLDKLEKHMLKDYFIFLENHSAYLFIHWNMRDEAYGFQAIEHRYRVLKGKPFILQDDRKLDLARVLVALYGRQYAPHLSESGRRGRLMSLIEMNGIADKDALQGEEEANAFKNGMYLELHRSTLRKVDAFANIIDRVHAKSLKTKASFMDKHGIHPVAIVDLIKNHPIITCCLFIITTATALVKFFGLF
ncbi:hypothetical protein BVG94_06435 [Serratia marcescens]|uniref:hypothetical protein n=1 Tax=Serratia marcescens TaxID=615 RepID=UPI000B6220E7|nr:hypothetical protein [Serratia marcescens]ASL92308.1 hypothetical protein BVG94_06435 [Serratia marcescens]